jgi:hypothetical protein
MFGNKLDVAMAIANGLAPMVLVFLRLAPETLQNMPLAPISPPKLKGFTTDEVVVTLATVFKVNDLGHKFHQ